MVSCVMDVSLSWRFWRLSSCSITPGCYSWLRPASVDRLQVGVGQFDGGFLLVNTALGWLGRSGGNSRTFGTCRRLRLKNLVCHRCFLSTSLTLWDLLTRYARHKRASTDPLQVGVREFHNSFLPCRQNEGKRVWRLLQHPHGHLLGQMDLILL